MSKKSKVVKLNSKARSSRKEIFVVYEGEKMTRAEREARIRQKERPQEEVQSVKIRKGTKVAESSSSQSMNTPVQPKPESNVWYKKAFYAVVAALVFAYKVVKETFAKFYAELDKVDSEDDAIEKWTLFMALIRGFAKCCVALWAKIFKNEVSKSEKKAESEKVKKSDGDEEIDEETVAVRYRNVPEGYLKRLAKDTALGADNRYKECQELISELDSVLKKISAAKPRKDATEEEKAQANAKRAELRKERDVLSNKLSIADSTGRSLERSADVYAHILGIVTKVKDLDFRKTERFEPKNLRLSKSEVEKIIEKFEGYHYVEKKVVKAKEEAPAPVEAPNAESDINETTIEVQVRNVPEGYLKRVAKDTALGADNRYAECRDIISQLNVVLADLGDSKTPSDASEELKKELSDKRAELRKKRNELENKLKIADSTGRSLERSADIYARVLEVVTKQKGIDFRKTGRFEPKNTKFTKAEIDQLVDKFEGTHTVVRTVKVSSEK